jgi:hypothetical protein
MFSKIISPSRRLLVCIYNEGHEIRIINIPHDDDGIYIPPSTSKQEKRPSIHHTRASRKRKHRDTTPHHELQYSKRTVNVSNLAEGFLCLLLFLFLLLYFPPRLWQGRLLRTRAFAFIIVHPSYTVPSGIPFTPVPPTVCGKTPYRP